MIKSEANTVTAINRKERVQQLEILASAGCVGTVEEQIRKLGATVKFIDRRLGYIDSLIPTDRLLGRLGRGRDGCCCGLVRAISD